MYLLIINLLALIFLTSEVVLFVGHAPMALYMTRIWSLCLQHVTLEMALITILLQPSGRSRGVPRFLWKPPFKIMIFLFLGFQNLSFQLIIVASLHMYV